MFQVTCSVLVEGDVEDSKDKLINVAGVKYNSRSAESNGKKTTLHYVWIVGEFEDAINMRKIIEHYFDKATVTVREA